MDAVGLQRVIASSPNLQREGLDQLLGPAGGIKRDTWEQGFRTLLGEMEGHSVDRLRNEIPTIVLNANLGPDATYHSGDAIVISVKTSTDCFFGLFSIDSRGSLRQVNPSARINANQTIRVVDSPRRSGKVFGVETLIGVASVNPIPLENQSGWDSFAESLRTWASTSSAPKRVGDREIAVLRYLAAP
jgi:hypothetical protein